MSARDFFAGAISMLAVMAGAALLAFAQESAESPILRAAATKLVWKAPTMRTDGYPFSMTTEGSNYLVNWTRGSEAGQISLAKTALEMSLTGFKGGTSFTITACDDTNPPQCSIPSNSVKISGGPPMSPSDVQSQ